MLLSNTKSDNFLQEIVASNIISLEKIKEVMTKATWFTYHRNYYLLVKYTSDLNFLIKLLVEEKLFKLKAWCGAKKTEFIDLYIYGISKIGLRGPLKEYLSWAQGN